jgi:hypothetical protein
MKNNVKLNYSGLECGSMAGSFNTVMKSVLHKMWEILQHIKYSQVNEVDSALLFYKVGSGEGVRGRAVG